MPRSLEEILAHADELADARGHHISWAAIGSLLGTTGEAARQRYGDLVKH